MLANVFWALLDIRQLLSLPVVCRCDAVQIYFFVSISLFVSVTLCHDDSGDGAIHQRHSRVRVSATVLVRGWALSIDYFSAVIEHLTKIK